MKKSRILLLTLWILLVINPPYTHYEPVEEPPIVCVAEPTPAVYEETYPFEAFIGQVSAETGVEAKLIRAIVQVESNYEPSAVNGKYKGLMQVSERNLPYIEKCYGRDFNLLDPYDNLLAGAFLLTGIQQNSHGSTEKDLMVYNLGGTNAAILWEKGIFNTPYTRKVMRTYESF